MFGAFSVLKACAPVAVARKAALAAIATTACGDDLNATLFDFLPSLELLTLFLIYLLSGGSHRGKAARILEQ